MSIVFEKVCEGYFSIEKLFENDHLVAFKDIHPIALVHIVIVPKKEISNLQSVEEGDLFIIAEVISVAQMLAARYGIANGYRLLTNNGSLAGQTILHLHFHLLGGQKLGPMA